MKLSKKLTKKKIIIVSIVAVVLIGGGIGVWRWQGTQRINREENLSSVFAPKESFSVQDISKGKVIENKKYGFRVEVPKDWKAETRSVSLNEGAITVTSPDTKVDSTTGFSTQGCGADILIIPDTTDVLPFLHIQRYIKLAKEKGVFTENNRQYRAIKVGGYDALEETLPFTDRQKSVLGLERGVNVKIPLGKRGYLITTVFHPVDKEKCEKAFSDILETVSIKR